MPRFKAALICALLTTSAILTLGCNSSTEPDETLVFDGIVRFSEESFHTFTLRKEGPLKITLTRLDALLVDISVLDPSFLSISVGIGQEVDGECLESVQFGLQRGGLLFFNLVPQTYCLSVFDGGQLPEDSSLAYTVTVDLP
jgi:hypothetical protein